MFGDSTSVRGTGDTNPGCGSLPELLLELQEGRRAAQRSRARLVGVRAERFGRSRPGKPLGETTARFRKIWERVSGETKARFRT